MPTAILLGGSGLVGRAVARRLVRAGWDVTIAARQPAHVPSDLTTTTSFVELERGDAASLANALGDGADLLVDCTCFTAADAQLLTPHTANAGSTVMLSGKAVYVDPLGNHVNSEVAPVFDGPILETNPTMKPGYGNYQSREGYGSNKVAAELELLENGQRVTILRASKVHGEGGRPPYEWAFVKRVLDQRPVVLLRDGGVAVNHTSAAANIAALVETCAAVPGTRVLNAADPDAPSVREISRTIADYFGHRWEEISVPSVGHGDLGLTPWEAATPIVLDTTAATQLGYVPVGDYAHTVREALAWLGERGREHPNELVEDWFVEDFLNYATEDEYLAKL